MTGVEVPSPQISVLIKNISTAKTGNIFREILIYLVMPEEPVRIVTITSLFSPTFFEEEATTQLVEGLKCTELLVDETLLS